jgi:phage shock protein C
MNSRLYRNRYGAMIGGVCSGLADYLGLPAWLVRLYFVLLALGPGVGTVLYFLLWAALPRRGEYEGDYARTGVVEMSRKASGMALEAAGNLSSLGRQAGLWAGLGLIIVGAVFFFGSLDIPWLRWLNLNTLWPLLLIIGGIFLLVRWVLPRH